MITQSGIEHPSTLQPTVGPTRLPPPVLVDSPPAFGEMIAALSGQPLLALDTESDSLYRYFFKVGLIQISTPATDYLVDPLRLPDLTPLGDILADPAVEKVFHAAENDILMLKRDFSFRFANVFDTMLAARILGWKQVSLAALLAQHFDVTLDKRAQLTDWGHRPLDAAQLSYARLDTHYLLPLRDLLIAELRQRRRWREARTRSPGCLRSPTSKNRLTRMASGGSKERAISAAVSSPCCASFICGATNRRASWTGRLSRSWVTTGWWT